MSTAPVPQIAPEAAGMAQARSCCGVCQHDLCAHDAIGIRFCEATQAQALSRNCICRST